MFSRIRLTLLTTVALAAAYFGYAAAVRALVRSDRPAPVFQVAPQDLQAVAAAPQIDETARIAREFLPRHEWAAVADLRFRDDAEDREAGPRLFYYSQDAEQTDDDHSLRFRPLAMVWFQHADRQPLAIVADEAVITFQSSIDLKSLDPGRVVGGQLVGAVSISGADGLAIDGNHFVFSEKSAKIHSSNPVEFAWKNHRGRAEQIQIDLDVDEAPLAGSPLAVSAIREVHLIHNVHMEFAVPQDGHKVAVGQKRSGVSELDSQSPDSRQRAATPSGEPEQPLIIDAEGSFRLQFTGPEERFMDQAIATFDRNVMARIETSPRKFDSISGDRIDLLLERPIGGEGSSSLASTMSTEGDAALAPRRLRVTRSKQSLVWLRSDENDLEAQMSTLDYDIAARRILLNDMDPRSAGRDAAADQQRVRLSFEGRRTELECAQIELRHDAEHHLKEVFCRGKGWLVSREDAESGAIAASQSKLADAGMPVGQGRAARLQTALQVEWQKQLRRYFDPKSGLDVIDVAGDAVVKIPRERSGATADYIKVWVDPLDSAMPERKSSEAGRRSESKSQPVPRRILALDRVTFVSPQIQGNMDELQVWFEDAPARSPESQRGQRAVSGRSADPLAGRKTIELASSSEPSVLPDADEESGKEPVEISARLTRVRMVRYAGEKSPDVAEVLCEDRVEVRHRRSPDEEPVVLTGNQLHIDNRGGADQRMHVLGQPARINDPQMSLEGAELYFSRGDSQAWVQGAGMMRLAVDKDLEGRPLPEPDDLTVTWAEQMVFDGQVAQFNGRINATLQDSSMRCREMLVTLAERISFGEAAAAGSSALSSGKKSPQAAIAKIDCSGLVEFDSHVVEDGGLVEVRRARVAEFSVNNLTNDVRALGPGTLTVWKRGQGNRASLGPVSMVAANRGLSAEKSKWEYSRIDFTRDMTGKIDQKSLLLQGQVQVVYGPVPAPLDVISVDDLPKDAGIMSCGELRVSQETGQQESSYVTLVASHNARLEGQSFFAQADEISYDESKGLYVLRSKGRDSILTREQQRGGKRAVAAARSLRFTPSQNKVQVDSASHIQGIQ